MQNGTPFARLGKQDKQRREAEAHRWLLARSNQDQRRIRRHLRLLLKEQTAIARMAERRGFFVEGPAGWRQDRALRRKQTLRQELQEMIGAADADLPSGSPANADMFDALDSWHFRLNFR